MICKYYYYIMKHLPFLSGIRPIMITTIISLLLKVMQLNMKFFVVLVVLSQLTTFHKLLKFVFVCICVYVCVIVLGEPWFFTGCKTSARATRHECRMSNVWMTNIFIVLCKKIIFITRLNFNVLSETNIKEILSHPWMEIVFKVIMFFFALKILTTVINIWLVQWNGSRPHKCFNI